MRNNAGMLAFGLVWIWQAAAAASPMHCPSGEAVAAEIERLGASASVAKVGASEVVVEGNRMRVSLRGLDGIVKGVREVAAPDDCHDRAAVAAVLISAWVGVWATGGFPDAAMPLRSAAPSGTRDPIPMAPAAEARPSAPALFPAPAPAASTSPTDPPRAAPPVPPSPATAAPPATAATRATLASATQPKLASGPRGRGIGLELAGFSFVTHDGDAAALGGGIEAGLLWPGWLSVASLFETTRQRDRQIGTAVAAYRIYRLGLGIGARHRWSHALGEAGLFPEVTLLTMEGRRLAESRAVTSWAAAADLRARLGIPLGRFRPFLFAGASYALRTQRLILDNRPDSIQISPWNLSLGVGVAYRFGSNE